jgi:hypothetical protein
MAKQKVTDRKKKQQEQLEIAASENHTMSYF